MTTTLRIAVLALVALLAGCAAPQRNVDSVSYTHLDVYKRQAAGRAGA